MTPPKFVWASEPQKAFDALKLALTTAPVLGYPNFEREFILETGALLRGLGAVLSQVDEEGKTHVIAYASQTLRPSEKSICNYSPAKLELLALKWAVTEKFRDYLLGQKCTVYTDNNPLAYVQTSKLGVSQIHWLSELALFNFNIIYRSGKNNQAADALSQHPEPNCKLENDSDSEDPVMLSYATMCNTIKPVLGDTKITFNIKKKAQAMSNLLEGQKSMLKFNAIPNLTAQTSAVSVFDQMPLTTMTEAQCKDSVLGLVIPYLHKGVKPKDSVVAKIRCKTACKYLQQFDRLVLKQGVLHHIYISNDVETHQLVLPLEYHETVLPMLHDDYGHQGLDQTLALVRERSYWSTMNHDATKYVTNCHLCHIAKGHYTGPDTQQGLLVANNPLNLLCIDFLKVDPSRDCKENILVLTDAFTKFSQAFVTNNQKALNITKILVKKWFYVYGIPAHNHSDKGQSFENAIISKLYSMYNIKQSMTMPYNLHGNSICEQFNCTMLGLLQSLPKEQKSCWPLHVPSLVFAYNATPHSVTGYLPYELMFGQNEPVVCDAWLGLAQYNDQASASKCAWLNEQQELLMSVNRQALKHNKQSAKKSQIRTGGMTLQIPIGNLVLLRDHPEGHNKIQDSYKSVPFVIVNHHKDPNVYIIQPLDKKGPKKTVNR